MAERILLIATFLVFLSLIFVVVFVGHMPAFLEWAP